MGFGLSDFPIAVAYRLMLSCDFTVSWLNGFIYVVEVTGD
jgi:hypothetical protein